mgnify:CR=1 FL=1
MESEVQCYPVIAQWLLCYTVSQKQGMKKKMIVIEEQNLMVKVALQSKSLRYIGWTVGKTIL